MGLSRESLRARCHSDALSANGGVLLGGGVVVVFPDEVRGSTSSPKLGFHSLAIGFKVLLPLLAKELGVDGEDSPPASSESLDIDNGGTLLEESVMDWGVDGDD